MFLTPSGGLEKEYQRSVKFGIKNNGVAQMLTAENPLTVNSWTHVAVTIEGEVGKLYIDGELKDTNPNMIINPSELTATNLYLGKSRVCQLKCVI